MKNKVLVKQLRVLISRLSTNRLSIREKRVVKLLMDTITLIGKEE